MTAKELMNPRFEVIADYPSNQNEVGTILQCPNFDNDFTKKYWIDSNERYPHLFRKMNWWEKRTADQMPKRVMSILDDKGDTFDIQEWDMEILVGWIDKKERIFCSLLIFEPKYGYVPVD